MGKKKVCLASIDPSNYVLNWTNIMYKQKDLLMLANRVHPNEEEKHLSIHVPFTFDNVCFNVVHISIKKK